jgi:hypothetical protein
LTVFAQLVFGNQLCGLTVTKSRSGFAAMRSALINRLVASQGRDFDLIHGQATWQARAGGKLAIDNAADCGPVVSGLTAAFD